MNITASYVTIEKIEEGVYMKQSKEMLFEHLQTQLSFLQASAKSYDSGSEEEAQRLALNIRILLHDTKSSNSLLSQLQIKDKMCFLTTASAYFTANMASYTGLFGMEMTVGTGGKYRPLCNMDDNVPNKWLQFSDWWNELIVDDKINIFSRRDLILMLANKDGGAHIDGEIDEGYANIKYNNSIGWIYSDGIQDYPFSNNAVYASARQIAEEFIISYAYYMGINKKVRKNMGEVMAKYINDKVYFAPIINDPIATKLFADNRVTKEEKRIYCVENTTFKDKSSNERYLLIS